MYNFCTNFTLLNLSSGELSLTHDVPWTKGRLESLQGSKLNSFTPNLTSDLKPSRQSQTLDISRYIQEDYNTFYF